eukprot:3524605-Rhodomonas_salina.1
MREIRKSNGEEGGKIAYLAGCARCVPKGARHAELVCDVGRLQQGRSPCPLGDNVRSRQTCADCAACGCEVLRGVRGAALRCTATREPEHERGQSGEKDAESDDDEPANALRQRRFIEERTSPV